MAYVSRIVVWNTYCGGCVEAFVRIRRFMKIFLLLTFVCFALFAPIETLVEVVPGLSIVAIIVTEMSKN